MKTTQTNPKRKSYGQYCPVATALDVVGDRWTMLILRELLGGSARFNELRDGLPGIASNLLTERLRRLEEDGVVRRIQTQSTVLYALTEQGAAIRFVLEELGFWGSRLERVGPAKHERSIRAIAMAMQAILVRAGDRLPDQRRVVELTVGGEPLDIVLDRRPTVAARPPTDPESRMEATAAAIKAFLNRGESDDQTIVHVSGDPEASEALRLALGVA